MSQAVPEHQTQREAYRSSRRAFLSAVAAGAAGALLDAPPSPGDSATSDPSLPAVKIKDVRLAKIRERKGSRTLTYIEVTTDAGVAGLNGPLGSEQTKRWGDLSGKVRELLVGQNPLRRDLDSEALWEAIYPGRFKSYVQGRDPLSGQPIWGTLRDGRYTPAGHVIMALSVLDNALWDLRGRLLRQPIYRLLDPANRERIPVYWRQGEAKDLQDARERAREAFDRGFKVQKWYFSYGAKDGKEGLRKNIELARVLREELGPQAGLMIDNHGIRHEDDADYVVGLIKRIAAYRPFFIEEPTAPENIEGYARIKGETDVPIATGEHWYTRWNVKPFLDRNLVDFVQVDPDWGGGISELIRICEWVSKNHRGVQVVPHAKNVLPACHLIASQPETLCPILEYSNPFVQSRQRLRQRPVEPAEGFLSVPGEPGLGPDLDWEKVERV